MRVLEVVGAPSCQTGSFERHLLALASVGATRGLEVGLCYPERLVPGTAFATAVQQAGIEVWDHPTCHKVDLGFLGWLVRLVRRERIDLLHAHFEPGSHLAVIAGRVTHRPVILTRHYLAANRPMSAHSALTAVVGRLTHRVVAVSEPVRRSLVRFGVPPSRTVTLPLGVDRNVFAPPGPAVREAARRRLGIGPDVTVVLATSHHRPGKGLDVLVEAAARAHNVLLLLAGGGPLSDTLRVQADRLGAPVLFTGQVDDVTGLLAAADIFCFPTVDYPDGLPMAVAEAMSCGLPVVTSPVPAVVDLLGEHDPAGVIVPAGDPVCLAAALDRLADDPVWRARLGRAGVTRSETLDLQRCASEMISLYANVGARG